MSKATGDTALKLFCSFHQCCIWKWIAMPLHYSVVT